MNTIIIFIKNIEKGKVKTRLAKTVGDEKALEIYQALLDHTRKTTQAIPATRFLFYSQHIEIFDEWPNDKFFKLSQNGVGLGDKMTNAFQEIFQKNNTNKVLIIGSDCPQLSPEILQEAFDQLDNHPFVLGPAMDGGYYLLGMRKFSPEVFKNMEWSTPDVRKETLKRIHQLNATCHLLEELSDIDYEEDWQKYGLY